MANKITFILDCFRRLQSRSDAIVLATIVETAGSTYQKAGARMLITEKGETFGLLGGGCFEADLIEQARSVFLTAEPKMVFYDMRSSDDAIWGLGLGCNGAVKIFLQRLTRNDDFSPLNGLCALADRGQSGWLATVVASEHATYPPGRCWWLDGADNTLPFADAVCEVQAKGRATLEKYRIYDRSIEVFYDDILPPARLLIVGAGADAVPVVQLAKTLGWHVALADYRPAYLDRQRFPEADQLLLVVPEALSEQVDLHRFDASVLMTHHFDYDSRYLQAIACSDIACIGLLGPAHRRDRLLDRLQAQAARLDGRLFGPAGLDIGAETPEEIALSIMAGIHAALHRRNGGQLALGVAR